MVSFDKKVPALATVLQVLPSLAVAFTSKIIVPSSLKSINPCYCLQCKYIMRSCKSTPKQLIIPACFTFERWYATPVAIENPINYLLNRLYTYILHAYILKLVLGDYAVSLL